MHTNALFYINDDVSILTFKCSVSYTLADQTTDLMLWSLKRLSSASAPKLWRTCALQRPAGFAEAVPRWPSVLSRRGHAMIPLHDAEADLARRH